MFKKIYINSKNLGKYCYYLSISSPGGVTVVGYKAPDADTRDRADAALKLFTQNSKKSSRLMEQRTNKAVK